MSPIKRKLIFGSVVKVRVREVAVMVWLSLQERNANVPRNDHDLKYVHSICVWALDQVALLLCVKRNQLS